MIGKSLISFIKKYRKGLGIILLTWGVFFLIFWPKMIYFNKSGDLVAGWKYVWADWAMHLTLINAFLNQSFVEVIKENPIYSGTSLSYPFFINLFTAIFVKLGLSLVDALIFISIILSFIFLFGFFKFGVKFLKSEAKAVLAIFIFFLNGGLGFWYFLEDLKGGFSIDKFLYAPKEYTNLPEKGIYFINLFLSHIVPQRALLFGITLGIFILINIYDWFKKDFKKTKKLNLFYWGIVSGSLAYIHNHSLILIFLVCTFLFLFNIKQYKNWLTFALGAAVSALPFFIFLKGNNLDSYIHLLPGWLANKREHDLNIFVFWLKNWGLFLPMFTISYLFLLKDKKRKIFIGAFVFVFLLANIITFQPSSWDNGKLFLWVYMIFSLVVSDIIVEIWNKKIGGKVVAVFLFIILSFSGSLDILRALDSEKSSYVMINAKELKMAEEIKGKTSSNSLFLTSDWHLHWVPVMTGRSIVMGYRGWLWSYGIDYGQREKDISAIYKGSYEGRKLISKYGINYIVIDRGTKDKFEVNENYFKNNFMIFYENGDTKIYEVN